MLNRMTIATLVVSLVASIGQAQVSEEDAQDRGRDDGRRMRGEPRGERGERQRMGRGNREGRRGPRFGRMFDRIADELELDDAQMQKWEEIRAAQRELMDEFRERRQAVREAREDGNEELADQLRAKMRADMEEQGGPREWMRQAFESLDPVLTDAQRTSLAEMRERFGNRRGGGEGGRGGEGRRGGGQWMGGMFDRLGEDLNLDETQAQQFEEIRAAQMERMQQFRQRREAIRAAREEGNDELADKLRAEMRAEMEESGGWRGRMGQTFDAIDEILNDEQRARLAEIREERRGGRGDRQRRALSEQRGEGRAAGSMEGLPEVLRLDDPQRAKYTALTQANREQQRETRTKIRGLRGQMREAEASGDEARVEELRGQIQELRASGEAAEVAFLDQVEGILRADQKERLAAFRSDRQINRDLEVVSADLRTVIRAAMRLKLKKEQKTELKRIAREARKSWREARKADKKNRSREKEAEKALAARVKGQVVGILDAEQAEKYEAQLKRLSRQSERRGRNRGVRL